jgi:hypothetical protein
MFRQMYRDAREVSSNTIFLVTANPPGPQFADTERHFPRFDCSDEFAKNQSYFRELYEFVPDQSGNGLNHWYMKIFPYYFVKLLDDQEFVKTSKDFNFSIYESVAQSRVLYDDLPILAKFVLTAWTDRKMAEQWYEYDLVDLRGKSKKFTFAVYEEYCSSNFQPTKWSENEFFKQMKPFAANLEYRGGGSKERKGLWLSLPELKVAWEKKFGYKFEDIAGFKIDENVIVLK